MDVPSNIETFRMTARHRMLNNGTAFTNRYLQVRVDEIAMLQGFNFISNCVMAREIRPFSKNSLERAHCYDARQQPSHV